MRSILYYIISKIKKLQSKDTEIDTEISGIKQDIIDINGDITNLQNNTAITELLTTDTVDTGTLTDNITNYKRIKIFYTASDNYKNSVEIYTNNTQRIFIPLLTTNNNGTMYIKSAQVEINGSSLIITRQYQSVLRTTPEITISSSNELTINRIEGYIV